MDLILQKALKADIREKGGYKTSIKNGRKTSKYTKGIVFYNYVNTKGTQTYVIESWDGSTMNALKGYRGAFYD